MRDKVGEIINYFESIEKQFSTQEVIGNPKLMKKIAKERSRLEPVVLKGRKYIERVFWNTLRTDRHLTQKIYK